jgi:hypothetical protein
MEEAMSEWLRHNAALIVRNNGWALGHPFFPKLNLAAAQESISWRQTAPLRNSLFISQSSCQLPLIVSTTELKVRVGHDKG